VYRTIDLKVRGDVIVRRWLRRSRLLLLILITLQSRSQGVIGSVSAAEERRALVIANGAYTFTRPLFTPPNDASLIKQQLEALHFQVTLQPNVTGLEFSDTLKTFLASITKDTVVFFYYAGHGVQYKGENFLIGVNATLKGEAPQGTEAYPLSKIIESLESKAETTLVFWDACRNNPLAHDDFQSGAAVLPSRSANTLVMFSAAPNQLAIDGVNYSPFAESLAAHIGTPNDDIEDMLKRVAIEVEAKTRKQQKPDRNHVQLNEIFYLNPVKPEIVDQIKKTQEYKQEFKSLPVPPKRRVIIQKVRFDLPPPSSNQPLASRDFVLAQFPDIKLEENTTNATIIRKMRLSPDGKLLALGGDDGFIRLMSLETFEVKASVQAHHGRVSDIDFSPDGRTLLSTGRDGTAQFWNIKEKELQKGEPVLGFRGKGLFSGRINPSFPDKYAIFGDVEGFLYTEDLKRHQLITHAKFHQGAIQALSYQPNGKGTFFSTGHDGLVKIRRPEGQRTVIKADNETIYEGEYDWKGDRFFTAGKDRKIKIWNANDWSGQRPARVLEGHLKYV
jgi:hypothetical protein